jgi:DNA-directed RNA polymerase specialized sigma24 family protein
MKGRALIDHEIRVLARSANPDVKKQMYSQAAFEVRIAALRCEPGRPFLRYVRKYIRGAILDVLHGEGRFGRLTRAGQKVSRDYLAERGFHVDPEPVDEDEDKGKSRRKMLELAKGLAATFVPGVAGEPVNPEEQMAVHQAYELTRAAMRKARGVLAKEQWQLIVGRFVAQKKLKVLAAELGVDESTVGKRVDKALRALWAAFAEEEITEAPPVYPGAPWGTLVELIEDASEDGASKGAPGDEAPEE